METEHNATPTNQSTTQVLRYEDLRIRLKMTQSVLQIRVGDVLDFRNHQHNWFG